MITLAAGILAISSGFVQETETYKFKNTAATYVTKALTGGQQGAKAQSIIPAELEYRIDVATNSITLKGKRADIDNVTHIFRMFDIRSMKVELEVVSWIPNVDREIKNTMVIANNGTWMHTEPGLEYRLEVNPRILEDGTCLLQLKHAALGSAFSATGRPKIGQWVELIADKWSHDGNRSANELRLKIRVLRVVEG